MKRRRMRLAAVLVASVVVAGAIGCGRSGPADETSTAGPDDVLAFVSSSGAKVAAADSFRYSFQNNDASEFNQSCDLTLQWDGAMDVSRKLAFLNVRSDEPTVIVSADTMYVRATVLPRWRVRRAWLSVPLTDLENLNDVEVALGITLRPDFWTDGGGSNPTMALEAIGDSVSDARQQGTESVRGVDTTHYDLTIDPARSGLWTGGTTSTTPAVPPTTSLENLQAFRQSMLDQMEKSGEPGADSIPDDVKRAFLAGDTGPLVGYMEQTTGTTMKPEDRLAFDAYTGGDLLGAIDAAEASSGTTMDPSGRKMMEALAAAQGGTPTDALGAMFNALTSVTASVWVDSDGVLRRLDQRVTMGSPDDTTPDDHPLVDVRLEFWDIGTPITDSVPDPGDVTPVSALSRTADIPRELSPCNMRIPNTTN